MDGLDMDTSVPRLYLNSWKTILEILTQSRYTHQARGRGSQDTKGMETASDHFQERTTLLKVTIILQVLTA